MKVSVWNDIMDEMWFDYNSESNVLNRPYPGQLSGLLEVKERHR